MDDGAQGLIASRVAPVQFPFRVTVPERGLRSGEGTAPDHGGVGGVRMPVDAVDNLGWSWLEQWSDRWRDRAHAGVRVAVSVTRIPIEVAITVGASADPPVACVVDT